MSSCTAVSVIADDDGSSASQSLIAVPGDATDSSTATQMMFNFVNRKEEEWLGGGAGACAGRLTVAGNST